MLDRSSRFPAWEMRAGERMAEAEEEEEEAEAE
jgi:hypothetical protein